MHTALRNRCSPKTPSRPTVTDTAGSDYWLSGTTDCSSSRTGGAMVVMSSLYPTISRFGYSSDVDPGSCTAAAGATEPSPPTTHVGPSPRKGLPVRGRDSGRHGLEPGVVGATTTGQRCTRSP